MFSSAALADNTTGRQCGGYNNTTGVYTARICSTTTLWSGYVKHLKTVYSLKDQHFDETSRRGSVVFSNKEYQYRSLFNDDVDVYKYKLVFNEKNGFWVELVNGPTPTTENHAWILFLIFVSLGIPVTLYNYFEHYIGEMVFPALAGILTTFAVAMALNPETGLSAVVGYIVLYILSFGMGIIKFNTLRKTQVDAILVSAYCMLPMFITEKLVSAGGVSVALMQWLMVCVGILMSTYIIAYARKKMIYT
ncbi:MAG: hypothetical protein H6779_00375 [Candidatus Nomurabacteria bacterium]|nr:MAG: hypothetical protein H6779_00375 [Candidatus Nomurabacteria bacterium]